MSGQADGVGRIPQDVQTHPGPFDAKAKCPEVGFSFSPALTTSTDCRGAQEARSAPASLHFSQLAREPRI